MILKEFYLNSYSILLYTCKTLEKFKFFKQKKNLGLNMYSVLATDVFRIIFDIQLRKHKF